MIRVMLADDQPMVRAGLRTILESDAGIEVVAEAADGRAVLDALARSRPDLVLLDIRMPDMDGLTAAETIRTRHPDVPVVIVTTFHEDRYVARALDAGVAGFVLKSADPYELIGAVKAAVAGGTVLAPVVARQILTSLRGRDLRDRLAARDEVAALTPRERDVLALVGAGLSNAQIAGRLHLAEGTVKTHLSTILGKLGVANRVQAAILAHQAGLA
ncbi:MAG TPA: response regulator transcription factor [Mycobacteriales bacterium]|nr:response regulator transcription factor [Mycobacteriales bacterium]